jgi:ATP-dependent DNA helicase RecQ
MPTELTLDQARATLRERFGYPDFRPGQTRAVESVLRGQDTLVVLPTGGGKSLCYQVPALMLPSLTVVISPLISLMKDQVDALASRGLPATFVNSTLPSSQVSDRMTRVLRGEFKLLYLAPERFDFGNTAERLRDRGVSLLAVDEAHCISEWGHDFRPSYLRIAHVRERLGWPPVVALTATATPHVRSDILRQLRLDKPKTIITGFDRTNLRYHVATTKTEREKDAAVVQILRDNEGLAVVYASTRKTVERIASVLTAARISAVAYHAGLDDAHRQEVQDDFMNERVRVIVATNAFGMGIDKPNVRLVIHYAMPGTLEAYYQEAGRAGRDGQNADCYLLHAFQDRFTHEFFIKGAYPERPLVEEVYEVLRAGARHANGSPLTAEHIAAMVKAKASTREVESAQRILADAGAFKAESPAQRGGRVTVRLLATPARIKRDLSSGNDQMQLGILRAMWRVAGESLNEGASIDLDGLPPGFGGPSGATPLLDALQSRQFIEWSKESSGGTLSDMRRPLAAFQVDWATLNRRREAELSKLQMMQRYAYTKGCRRGFVLRYFGDPAARSSCGGCDNCLGVRVAIRPGAAPATKSKKKASSREPKPQEKEVPLTPADETLLERLRTLRRAIAQDERVPAYVVFSDRTLREMASRRPADRKALQEIRGVGPAKLERYGERFLAIVRTADGMEAA